jgi:methionyl-tRNA formyltransferase
MKLLVLGTGPFAVPMFSALLDSVHDVAALVTRPTQAARGRHKAPVNPMRDAAERRGLTVFDPDDINSDAGQRIITAQAPELLVVCDYGQILAAETLSRIPLGGVNLHASLLPKYRGAAPINWAILRGETETGVTVIHMTPRLDAGPCLVQRRTEIGPSETAVELEARLGELGISAVLDAIEILAAWDRTSPIGQVQDSAGATRARRLRKEDGEIDWSSSAAKIRNQIRALKPWPATYTHWQRPGGESLRVIIDDASVVGGTADAVAPGSVAYADATSVHVATGDGLLSIDRIQPAGKRAMGIDEFQRGHRIEPGHRFGTLP